MAYGRGVNDMDDKGALRRFLAAIEGCDCIVTAGGSSADML